MSTTCKPNGNISGLKDNKPTASRSLPSNGTFHQTPAPQFSETEKEEKKKKKKTEPVKQPHRGFPAPAGTEEEDGVVAGLGDGASDEVLEFAARPKNPGGLVRLFRAMRVRGSIGGSPVVGVRGGPEGGVDEPRIAEPAPEHRLRLARHGRRRRHNVCRNRERLGRRKWGQAGSRGRAGNMTRRRLALPLWRRF